MKKQVVVVAISGLLGASIALAVLMVEEIEEGDPDQLRICRRS